MRYQACTQTGGDFAAKLIENRVRSLAGLKGKWQLDPDDLRQELWIELALKWPRFDPQKGSEHAFIRAVIGNKITKLLEHAEAQCRDYRREIRRLDERTLDEEGVACSFGEIADIEDLLPLVGLGTDSDFPIHELKLDLERAMRELDAEEASLCRDLLRLTILEISQARGISRGSIYDALRRIRKKVAPILGEYFSPTSRQINDGSGNRKEE
jgi:RNA polymerase sigma-70 factor (ECF subfamily)